MNRLAIFGLAVTVGAAVGLAQVQTPAPQFRSRVDLVHLDVSVLDRDRRPVRALTAADFTILEDGRPQAVAAFSAVDLADPPPPPTPWVRDVAPDVRRNTEVSDRRLIVIVMDDATIPFDQPMIRSAREIARLAIERLGPNDLASVVFTRDNRNAQEFTNDRARLLKAVESFEYGGRMIGLLAPDGPPPPGLVLAESAALIQSVGTLSRVAESLADVPQRRKAVIFVTVGVPVDAAGASEITIVTPEDGAGAAEIGSVSRRLMDVMKETYRRAQRANVNIYTVSPAGVGGMAAYIQSQQWQGRFVPPYETPSNYSDFLVGIAENTGGRAFSERNEFATALTQVFLENGSYYLLGYQPPNPALDGRYRRIEVTVNRPGVTVRTRSGYYNAGTRAVEAKAEVPPLTAALAGLLPKTDVPLDVMAAPFAIPGKTDAGVVVVLTVHEDLPARPARTSKDVDLQITAFTQEGVQRGSEHLKTKVTLRPGPAGPAEYEVLSQITLRPGRYQLRLSADTGDRAGSVYYDLDVPDFSARPLSLSGIVLSSDPRPVSTPADRIKALVPVAPTARRAFSQRDRVTVFGRIYQGGRDAVVPTTVVVKVTDATGAVRMNRPHLLTVSDVTGTTPALRSRVPAGDTAATANRSVDFSMDLPLRTLPAGEYLLTVEASTARGAAKWDVRFAITK